MIEGSKHFLLISSYYMACPSSLDTSLNRYRTRSIDMSIYVIWSWKKRYGTGGRSQSNNLSQSRVHNIQSAESRVITSQIGTKNPTPPVPNDKKNVKRTATLEMHAVRCKVLRLF